MSGEAHFHKIGYVNKQNYRIWGAKNPIMIIHEQLASAQKVTGWCA